MSFNKDSTDIKVPTDTMFENNVFCKLLGIKYPIIQGGMAWVADANLAAAVSNGGGLGLIAAMNSNGEQLREEIRKIKKLTDKPFGVNIMLMSPFADEAAKVVVEEGVKILTTGAGRPTKYMKDWIAAGLIVMPVIAYSVFAKLAMRDGAHAIIAEGCEAGGHIGELTTMALIPQITDCVNVPVAAAGGIADGRGMAAAFMLGAKAVQVGTAFLAAKECGIHQNYKDMVFKAADSDTIVTGRKTGHPVRALKSQLTREFAAFENDAGFTIEEFEKKGAGTLRAAVKDGDLAKGSFMAGQVAGLIKEELDAAEIMKRMVEGAAKILGSASECLK